MAAITVHIPDGHVDRAVDALCAAGGYSGDPDDHASRRRFARRQVADFIKQVVIQYERQQAMAAVTVEPITVD